MSESYLERVIDIAGWKAQYDLTTRGVYYTSRMISEQIYTEFKPPFYDDIKKVYSIWVCFNAPKVDRNKDVIEDSITKIALEPKVLYAKNPEHVHIGRYDLISIVMICLGDDSASSQNELVGMLSTLFSSTLEIDKKKFYVMNIG